VLVTGGHSLSEGGGCVLGQSTDMQPIELRFTVAPEEAERFIARELHKKYVPRMGFKIAGTVLAVFPIVGGIIMLAFEEFSILNSLKGSAISLSGVAMVAFLFSRYNWLARRQVRKMIGNRENIALFHEQIIRLDSSGVHQQALETTTTWRWSAIYDVAYTDDLLLLYLSKAVALLIPARALPDDLTVDNFMHRVAQWRTQAPPPHHRQYPE